MIDQFFDCGTLGESSPSALIHSMWFICTLHFGMRTGNEVHCLRFGDIQLKEDSLGEYLIYDTERQTKTRSGVNPRDTRLGKPRVYAIPDSRKDPVSLYKSYVSKRPTEMMDPDSPFFLSVANKAPSHLQAWYKKQGMGINKLYGIMEEMKTDAGLQSDKRITPYSVRKHLVQKLNDSGVPPHQIVQMSGHKNVNSLNNYSKLNPEQSKGISDILANSNKPEKSLVPFNPVCNPHLQAMNTAQWQSPFPMLGGSTFNGPVTFNFDNKSSSSTCLTHTQSVCHERTELSPEFPPRKWKRIRCITDSDSD